MNIYQEFCRVFDTEINQLCLTKEFVEEGELEQAIRILKECTGRVILSGMGKPGYIAQKISATMSSLGIRSFYLHPAEAAHGDLGRLTSEDVLIIISNSGNTDEISRIIPNIKLIGVKIIAITSNKKSVLSQHADCVLLLPAYKEACYLNLAPTTSTTAELVIGDALAIILSRLINFDRKQFALYHPAGTLGKNLIAKVKHVMRCEGDCPMVYKEDSLQQTIVNMSASGVGAVCVVDENQKLVGLITDGDLRRFMMNYGDIYHCRAGEIMTTKPVTTTSEALAADVLKKMGNDGKMLSILPVVQEDGLLAGIVCLQDLVQYGISINNGM